MRLLRSLCPLCKYSVPVFFSPFLPPASQPQTTLLIKGFCKKDGKENRTFQEGCQKKWLNEAEGQLESGVKEGDKGTIQKLSLENWGKNQSNAMGRVEVTRALPIIIRSQSLRQEKQQGQLRGLRQRMAYLEKDIFFFFFFFFEKDIFNSHTWGWRGSSSGSPRVGYI